MKAQVIGLAVLCAQTAVAHVLPNAPHRAGKALDHQVHHHKRDIATAFVTKTNVLTVTDYSVIVVVDKSGHILRTDHRLTTFAAWSPPTALWTPAPIPTAKTVIPVSAQVKNDDVAANMLVAQTSDGDTMSQASSGAPTQSAYGTDSITSSTSTIASSTTSIASVSFTGSPGVLSGFSVDYDPIGGNTDVHPCRNFDADFAELAGKGVGLVRVYDIGCPLDQVVNAASAHNLKLMIGLNTISNLNADLTTLITMVTGSTAGWGPVDTVYIGNELVRHGADPGVIAAAVTTAKQLLSSHGYNGNVVTVDTFGNFATDSTLCSTSSYCAINAHAFFDPNTSADQAGVFVRNAYNQVAAKNNGKRIVISETGWPNQGDANGAAIASPDNQRTAMSAIMKEFAATPADVYLFQAWAAGYKAPGQFGVEPFFGLFDVGHYNGVL